MSAALGGDRSPAVPLSATAFAALMRPFGPFAPHPHVAVAVSGGADSLALVILADRWARKRGSRVTALTVDHGLRPGSAGEARQVARWLKAAGIAHRILRWTPPVSVGRQNGGRLANLQARAREARYGLLAQWCLAQGVRDLLLAHHREDQAETFLLRLARGSGVDGLAAMAPVALWRAPGGDVRLLRPLLAVPKAALVAVLRRRGQPWIEDPSNADPANARVRFRRLMPQLAAEGLTAERLAATAAVLAQARAALGEARDALLAQAVTWHDAGFAELAPLALAAAPREVGLRALSDVLQRIGGEPYPARYERLCRFYDEIVAQKGVMPGRIGGGRTLAGCRIRPRHDGALLILREAAAMAPPLMLGREPLIWDGRFRVSLSGDRARRRSRGSIDGLAVGAVGDDGLRDLRRSTADLPPTGIPKLVWPTLPALRDRSGLLAVPHLGYRRAVAPRRNARRKSAEVIDGVEDYRIEFLAHP